MTPKQTALCLLARRALNSVSESAASERAEVCTLVAAALQDDCPEIAKLAAKAAHDFNAAQETEEDLITHLKPEA